MQLWCNQKQWEGATNYERSKIHKIHRLEPQISHGLLSCYFFKRWWTFNLRENLNPTEMNMFYPLKSHIPVFFLDQQPPLGASMLWKLSWNLGHAVKTILKSWPLWDLVCQGLSMLIHIQKKTWAPWFGHVSKSQNCWPPFRDGVEHSFHRVPWWPWEISPGTTHGWWRGCNFFHHPWLRTQQVPVPRTNSTWYQSCWALTSSSRVTSSFFQPRLGKKKEMMGRKPGEIMKHYLPHRIHVCHIW